MLWLLLPGTAQAAIPQVAASNYLFSSDMNYIMYDLDAVWTASDFAYKGFQMQTWATCHSGAYDTATNLSAKALCEANRHGDLLSADTNAYCSGQNRDQRTAPTDIDDGSTFACKKTYSNTSNASGFADADLCLNPYCWTDACDYDKVDCLYASDTTLDTQGNSAWSSGNSFYGTKDMCSWDHEYERQLASATTVNEYKAHDQFNDLDRISDYYYNDWKYNTNVITHYEPYQGMSLRRVTTSGSKIAYHKNGFTTYVDSTGLKVAYNWRSRSLTGVTAASDSLLKECNHGDTISAFTVKRHTDGKFVYSAVVKIGTYLNADLDWPSVMKPTKFYWDPLDTATSSKWFYMRSDNHAYDSAKPHDSSLSAGNLNFACMREDQINGRACTGTYGTSNKCFEQSDSVNAKCLCGGIKDLLDGSRTIFTAACASTTAGGWDGYFKCTLTDTTTTLAKQCASGDALVHVGSRSVETETGYEGVDTFTNAVVGYFLTTPVALTSTEYMYTVAEDDKVFPAPIYNHPNLLNTSVTLLIGCNTTAAEPTTFWTAPDLVDGTKNRYFNAVYNELAGFSTVCRAGAYLVGSVDGHTWTKIARITSAVTQGFLDVNV